MHVRYEYIIRNYFVYVCINGYKTVYKKYKLVLWTSTKSYLYYYKQRQTRSIVLFLFFGE